MGELTTEEKESKKAERDAKWEREMQMRFEILVIQYDEATLLHSDFPARLSRANALEEARIADHLSVVEHRADVIAEFQKQTVVLERQTLALERIATALEKR